MFSYFASAADDAALLALITILGTVITALFKLLQTNTKALADVAAANQLVADATTQAAKEAAERNGHLGDQNIKIAELVAKQNDDIRVMKETGQKNLQANAQIVQILARSDTIQADAENPLKVEVTKDASANY